VFAADLRPDEEERGHVMPQTVAATLGRRQTGTNLTNPGLTQASGQNEEEKKEKQK
jgi:hypothetical protein